MRHKLKFKKHNKAKNAKNTLLSEKLIYTGTSEYNTSMQLIQYDETHIEVFGLKSVEELSVKRNENSVCWLNISGLSDTKLISDIGHYFSLHILEMQDILNNDHIPKIEEYEDNNNILLILKALSIDENQELHKEQLAFVLGNNFLLTFQETDTPYFDDIKKALHETNSKLWKKSPDYLALLLLHKICDNYTALIDCVEYDLEELETELMDVNKNQVDISQQIQLLRIKYLLLKKTVQPLKESFAFFLRSDSDLLNEKNIAYFNDVHDHLLMAVQKIDVCREVITSLLDLYLAKNDLKMNNIMKQLTVIGSIFIPLTFVAGLWGMNFRNMPELELEYGYYLAWGLMIFIGVGGWLYFKFKKWY
ncbi:MAG: magnesium/cobalt transporter CorA [Bacteroidetes bacterium]|nr:magnesium/cobalt transporter CorA [Bacteroidota bacterium]MCL2303011.1 magnesium/cobalt transporter CorA [Lentimicrobiaceae bacterium]